MFEYLETTRHIFRVGFRTPMLQKILQIISKEDSFNIFTADVPSSSSIFEAVSVVRDPNNIFEVQNAVMYFFSRIIQTNEPGSFYHSEAIRIMNVCDKVFNSLIAEGINTEHAPRVPRDLNDEIVDLYIESLNFFASGLDEPILMEHIRYLEE